MKTIAMHIDKKLYKTTVNFINYKIHNLEDSQDIAQIALSKAYFNESKLKDKTKFKSWMYKIIMREIANFKRINYVPLELIDIGHDVDLGFIDRDIIFSRLSRKHRKLLWLVVYGYNHKEIRQKTGIKNTRTMKNYLIKKLME